MKNVYSKMHEKTQRSTGKTSRYIEFDIGASFTLLLILRQLEKISDVIVKQTNKIDLKKHGKTQRSAKKLSDTSNLISVRRLQCC